MDFVPCLFGTESSFNFWRIVMKNLKMVLIAFVVFVGGCVNSIQCFSSPVFNLTYKSVLSGAAIIQKSNNENIGVTSMSQKNNLSYNRNGSYAAAKRQYESALAGYNRALSNLDKARNTKGPSGFLGIGHGGTRDRAMRLLGKTSSRGALRAKERELRSAEERLHRAKAKLRAAEHCFVTNECCSRASCSVVA